MRSCFVRAARLKRLAYQSSGLPPPQSPDDNSAHCTGRAKRAPVVIRRSGRRAPRPFRVGEFPNVIVVGRLRRCGFAATVRAQWFDVAGGVPRGILHTTGGGVLPRRGDGDPRVRRSRYALLDPTTRSRSSQARVPSTSHRGRALAAHACEPQLKPPGTGHERAALRRQSRQQVHRGIVHLVDAGEIKNGHAAVHGIEEELKGLAGQRPDDACSRRRARLRRDHDAAASRGIARS